MASGDPALVLHLGWRILPDDHAIPEHPVLCPRCVRRHLSALK